MIKILNTTRHTYMEKSLLERRTPSQSCPRLPCPRPRRTCRWWLRLSLRRRLIQVQEPMKKLNVFKIRPILFFVRVNTLKNSAGLRRKMGPMQVKIEQKGAFKTQLMTIEPSNFICSANLSNFLMLTRPLSQSWWRIFRINGQVWQTKFPILMFSNDDILPARHFRPLHRCPPWWLCTSCASPSVIFRSDERRSRDVWGDVIVKNIFRNPSNKSDILFKEQHGTNQL